MKQIQIKRLTLTNFKGVRQQTVEFDGSPAVISGMNGSGKTTIFDAFTWVLFGKDSQWRGEFKIKTIDPNGIEITRIPHEVELVLLVNGEQVTLRRSYKEKWVKRRGEVDERFEGHTQERFWNDVPCSEKEYDAKVAEICPMETFRLLTSTTAFTSLKPMAQREVLIRMAGGITDSEVAANNADFAELLGMLTGKTIDELKKEVSAKRNRIKAEAEQIPAKIEENQRMRPADADYDALKKERAEKEQKIAEIDAQLADAAKMRTAALDKQAERNRQIASLESQLYEIQQQHTSDAEKQWREQCSLRADRQQAIGSCQADIDRLQNAIAREMNEEDIIRKDIDDCDRRRSALIEERAAIRAAKIETSDNDFICPVCGHVYDAMERAKKLHDMQDALNKDKASRLASNTERGKANQAIKQQHESHLERLLTLIQEQRDEIAAKLAAKQQAQSWLDSNPEPERPNLTALLSQDGEYARIAAEIGAIEEDMLSQTEIATDAAELTEAKKILMENISELNQQLYNESVAQNIDQRIATLKQQYSELSAEMASLEKIEYTIGEFSRTKIRMVEDKINALFSLVKFKMFDTQVNGAVVETCEATVDGVPFSSLNHAARINAGLDIISAISKHYGTEAPIFIDNAESVNQIMPTQAQQIRLAVSVSRQLQINKINISQTI